MSDATNSNSPEVVMGEGFAEKRPLDILEKQKEKIEVKDVVPAGLPTIITLEMRKELLAFGYNPMQINAMTAGRAWQLLKEERDKNMKGELGDTPLKQAKQPTDLDLEVVHPIKAKQQKIETIVPAVPETPAEKYIQNKDVVEYVRVLMKEPKRKRVLVDLKMGLDAANSKEYTTGLITSERDQGKISEKEYREMMALLGVTDVLTTKEPIKAQTPKIQNPLDTLVQDSAGASAILMEEQARIEAGANLSPSGELIV